MCLPCNAPDGSDTVLLHSMLKKFLEKEKANSRRLLSLPHSLPLSSRRTLSRRRHPTVRSLRRRTTSRATARHRAHAPQIRDPRQSDSTWMGGRARCLDLGGTTSLRAGRGRSCHASCGLPPPQVSCSRRPHAPLPGRRAPLWRC